MFVRTPFNYDGDVDSFKSGLDCSDFPSLAQQHMRDECDINVMVERFSRTGVPEPPQGVPTNADFEGIFDFQSAMNAIVAGRRAFGSLPAKVRARFQNDPAQFLGFLQDDSNRLEAEALGLVERASEPVSEPQAPVVAPEA